MVTSCTSWECCSASCWWCRSTVAGTTGIPTSLQALHKGGGRVLGFIILEFEGMRLNVCMIILEPLEHYWAGCKYRLLLFRCLYQHHEGATVAPWDGVVNISSVPNQADWGPGGVERVGGRKGVGYMLSTANNGKGFTHLGINSGQTTQNPLPYISNLW